MNDTNFWNNLMGSREEAATYMLSYGEGPGTDTRKILERFITKNDSVLDVGCGPGWNMDHFAEYGPKVRLYKGVDYASYFVEVANERRAQKQLNTFSEPFELQDCRDLQEPDNSWDVVIVQDCLEHTNGYEKPIQEALRVSRGRVIVGFWHLVHDKVHAPKINDDGDDGYGTWYSASDWRDYLDTLPVSWFHEQIIDHQGKPRDFYVLNKKEVAS